MDSPRDRENPARIKGMCNWSHAAGRAMERGNIPPWQFAEIGKAVAAHVRGDIPIYQIVELAPDKTYKNRSWYAAYVEGRWEGVVFDRSTMSPVTFLPPEKIESWRSSLDRMVPVAAVEDPVEKATDSDLLWEIFEASQCDFPRRFQEKHPRLMKAIGEVHRRCSNGTN